MLLKCISCSQLFHSPVKTVKCPHCNSFSDQVNYDDDAYDDSFSRVMVGLAEVAILVDSDDSFSGGGGDFGGGGSGDSW